MSLTLRTYKECQYWLSEPSRCKYWNITTSMCEYFTYGGIALTDAEGCHPDIKFPFCNLLGTAKNTCAGYQSTGENKAICILPDPSRHVLNTITNNKWVTSVTNTITFDDANLLVPPSDWTFSNITKYNSGDCDGKGQGTKATCTGYSPQQLGFSSIAPRVSEPDISDEPGLFSFDHTLPMDYTLLNIRANLSPCYWWSGPVHQYSLDPDTGKNIEVDAPGIYDDPDPTKVPVTNADGSISYYKVILLALVSFDSGCTFSNESEVEPFKSGGADEFQYKCNGCSTSCPHYTGHCWQYCTDNKILPGFGVLAEQVLELRWMSRKTNWTKEIFETMFDNPYIWSWTTPIDGSSSVTINPQGILDYTFQIDKVFIEDYNNFKINYLYETTSQGTQGPDSPPSFPDLIKELKLGTKGVVIRNKFEVDPGDDGIPYYEFSVLDNPEVYIYGDVPSVTDTYVINLNDTLFRHTLPEELYTYNNTFDIIRELTTTQYSIFTTKLANVIEDLLYTDPDKMRKSLTGQSNYTFISNVNVNYGRNRIAVFNRFSGQWVFSILEFDGLHVGAVVRQTSYSLEGDGSPTWYGPNYEAGTGTPANDNGAIDITVDPIVNDSWSPEVSYVYNDFSYQEINDYQAGPNDPPAKYITGYILYEEIIPEIILSQKEVVQLNSCHLVLTIDNSSLTNVIYSWVPEKIELTYSDNTTCEFIIVANSNTQLLAPNQIIVFPKDIKKFKSFCLHSGDTFKLTNVSNFHKRSFNSYEPPASNIGSEMRAISLHSNPGYIENPSLEGADYDYTLRKFDTTIHFGAVLKNRAGREFSTTKTNLLYWIKQPFCPDVEIRYSWLGDYDIYELSPRCRCVGEFTEGAALTENISEAWFSMPYGVSIPYSEFNDPYCGDHDIIRKYKGDLGAFIGANNKIGAMWYPYTQCDGYQSYDIITNQDQSAMEIMSDFIEKDGDGSYKHGQHDLRMLGPDRALGWTGEYCFMPSACDCGRQHMNGKKKGEPEYSRFIGYAQYRSGVSSSQLASWYIEAVELGNLSIPGARSAPYFPGFGNSSRPFLRSFRSNHRGQYYHQNSFGPGGAAYPKRSWKYMPAPADFSLANFTSTTSKMFDDYSSDTGPQSINTLGMVLFDSLEGNGYIESIDLSNIYSYNEVFRNHSGELTDNILYPKPKGVYSRSSIPWRDFQGNIQWAWRLPWENIERNTVQMDGYFIGCLTLLYPPYKYNYTLAETRACPVSGEHRINFFAPLLEADGKYISNSAFNIDSGPKHSFSFTDGWTSTTSGNNDHDDTNDVYKNISEDENYYSDISLATSMDAYEVFMGKESGEDKNYYGHEGLAAVLSLDLLSTLPQTTQLLTVDQDYTATLVDTSIDTDENNIEILYRFGDVSGYVTRIGKFSYTSNFGVSPNKPFLLSLNGTQREITLDIYYHIPGVIIYAPLNSEWIEIGSAPMQLLNAGSNSRVVNKTTTIDMKLPAEYMWNGGEELLVVFRNTPTDDELYLSGYTTNTFIGINKFSNSYVNYSFINDIDLWSTWLTNGTEVINTYERKFRVSRAGTPEEQPQGAGEDRLLMAPTNEVSTVYQQDSRTGIRKAKVISKYDEYEPNSTLDDSAGTKLYRSKCRSRQVYDIILEQTPININGVSDLHNAEALPTDMYNEKALSDETEYINAHHFILPEIAAIMNNNGLYFYSSGLVLSMSNTFIAKLAVLIAQQPYCPAGHAYMPSPYYSTSCKPANESFYYVFAQIESNKDVTLVHNLLAAGGGYSTDTEVQGMVDASMGYGTLYIADEDQNVPGYHKTPNAVSKYVLGTTLYQSRKEAASYLYHGVYPMVFSRFTKSGAFFDNLTELSMPPSISSFPLLHFTSGVVHESANTARSSFWLAGGVSWRDKYTGQQSYS